LIFDHLRALFNWIHHHILLTIQFCYQNQEKEKSTAIHYFAKMEVMIPNATSSIPEEVKAFDATKAGVKGLVDSGVTKIPRFFVHPPEDVQKLSSEIINI